MSILCRVVVIMEREQMTIKSVIKKAIEGLKCICKKANCMDCPEHQLWAVPDPIVGQMARFPAHADKAESLRVIREIFCKPEFYAVLSREAGAVIGCVSLHPGTKGVDVYEAEELTIGYWMGKQYWGHGFMTEAVKMLCDRCRSSGQFKCKRIIGFTSTDNAGSQRVMEKVGFRHVETKDGTVRYALDLIESRRIGYPQACSAYMEQGR